MKMLKQCSASQTEEVNCKINFRYPTKLKQQTFMKRNTPFSYFTKPKKTVDTYFREIQNKQRNIWMFSANFSQDNVAGEG